MTIPFLSINNVSQNEGNSGSSTFDFVVSLSEASATPATVNYVISEVDALEGLDYAGGGLGTFTFAPGQTSEVITVTVYGDLLYENNETFLVGLSSASGAAWAPSSTMIPCRRSRSILRASPRGIPAPRTSPSR